MAKMTKPVGRDTLTRVQSPSNARDVAERSKPPGPGTEPDEIFGLVSVLYHALQGTSAYDQYVGDAQTAGDAELERFFRACRTEEHARARRAKGLLLARLGEQVGEDSEFVPTEPEPEDER
jgi:hypothetical protein